VKKGPDGDYNVSSATAADILVSSIANKAADVYYMADLFFNDDGDIMAVYVYDKDLANSSTSVTPQNTGDLKVDVTTGTNGTGKIYSPIQLTAENVKDTDYIAEIMNAYEDGLGDYITTVDNTAFVGDEQVSSLNLSTNGTTTKTIVVTKNGVKTYYEVTFTNADAEKADKAIAEQKAALAAISDGGETRTELDDAYNDFKSSTKDATALNTLFVAINTYNDAVTAYNKAYNGTEKFAATTADINAVGDLTFTDVSATTYKKCFSVAVTENDASGSATNFAASTKTTGSVSVSTGTKIYITVDPADASLGAFVNGSEAQVGDVTITKEGYNDFVLTVTVS
jgi:hypothetical protein